MSNNKFGNIVEVNLRDSWENEALDFTPWLALPENINILGDALGIELEVIDTEVNIGNFKADIFAKDLNSNSFVIIENQLEKTDHSHLGQLITYASGLDAKTIIWISKKFTEEHRSAMDWMNQISDEFFNFFGIELELWKIGDSLPAPRFSIVSKPNEWTKNVRSSRGTSPKSDNYTMKYWTEFNNHLEINNSNLKTRKPYPQNWITYGLGKSGFTLEAILNSRDNWIAITVWIKGEKNHEYFTLLKEKYESAAGVELSEDIIWELRPDKVKDMIRLKRNGVDPLNESDWKNQFQWLEENILKFQTFFTDKLKGIDNLLENQ